MRTITRLRAVVIGLASAATHTPLAGPLPLLNHASGISLSLSGTNGFDWAVEHTYHDASMADQLLYVKSDTLFSFAHNANNSIMVRDSKLPGIVGEHGLDGVPRSGDEGELLVKVDRDLQSHSYTSVEGSIPPWVMAWPKPFSFAGTSFDGSAPVLGDVSIHGGNWGASPMRSTDRFAGGQRDESGNEWHTLTYWDDDGPLYAKAGIPPHRQAASDGHWVYVCVNPRTPILQLVAPDGEQFYTTPKKTYHVPRTWAPTSYLTGGILIQFVNLANGEPVYYRVGDGAWTRYEGAPLAASALIPRENRPALLSFKAGEDGAVATRTLVVNPPTPAPGERHGYLLWANDAERLACVEKLRKVEPFARSYQQYLSPHHQRPGEKFADARGGWRATAGDASATLANAFSLAVDGAETRADAALLAKTRLLRMARLEAVGFEDGVSRATPSKDYLNELGQTIQQFADAGIAYDFLAAHFRKADHPDGMTPIEELRIRDGLAEVAKTALQMRGNWSFEQGGGDTHWAHGYEVAIGVIAAAMPEYATPYFGVSGADGRTRNNFHAGDGTCWNPFPDQGVTWWDIATDPDLATPGHPNVRHPLRAEMLYTDDGWWVGPNDLQGDGERYCSGGLRRMLVDLNYGGMANAECRVELVEMSGYEAAFPERLHVFDFIRRIRGDTDLQPGVTSYIRRRLMHGFTLLDWDDVQNIYRAQEPRVDQSVWAFNTHYNAARHPGTKARMRAFLDEVLRSYDAKGASAPPEMESRRNVLVGAYALALCADPATIGDPDPEANLAPIVKPMFKHVVRPGERIHKTIVAMDPNEDELQIKVEDLPSGARYDEATRTMDWRPGEGDAGVHAVTVSASDGKATTERPFLMIVKPDAPSDSIPKPPANVTAVVQGTSLILSWSPSPSPDILHCVVYRDGIPVRALPGNATEWRDEAMLPGTHTRYYVSVIDRRGAESLAATPATIPHVRRRTTMTTERQRKGP